MRPLSDRTKAVVASDQLQQRLRKLAASPVRRSKRFILRCTVLFSYFSRLHAGDPDDFFVALLSSNVY